MLAPELEPDGPRRTPEIEGQNFTDQTASDVVAPENVDYAGAHLTIGLQLKGGGR